MRIRSGTLTGSWGNRSTSKRLPSSSMTSRRGGGRPSEAAPSIVAGSSDDRSMPSSTSTVETSPAVNAGSSISQAVEGDGGGYALDLELVQGPQHPPPGLVPVPSPQTISLASSES